MAFDLEGAKREGYSDQEIANYLASQNKFDIAGARKEGYGDGEIISHLMGKAGPAAVSPPPRSSSLLDRLTAGLAEGIKASGAESDLMTAAGGPVELPSLTDAGTSLARGITSGMMTVPELGAKLLGDAADQEKYKAARLGMADERAEAKKNYGIGGKVLLDMLEGGGSLAATLPVDILTGGITKDVLMADRVARLFSPMLKGVIEASPGFALGMAGRGALTEAADREYDPLTRAARTVAGGVEGLTLGKLFETAMGVGKGLDLPGRLAAQLGVQTPLGVGMAGMEAAKEGRMPTVEELASGAGMGAGFGIFGALKGKPKLDTEALNDFKYERDMFRSELADRVREFAGDRMSDAEADAFTRVFETAELKKQNISKPSAEDYRRGRENLANISEAMRQGFNRERGLNLLEPPGGMKAEGVLSNPIAAEAILRGNKPPRIEADETALGVNAALERLLQEMGGEKALPPGQGFELKDEPAMSRFSPELASLVRQLSGRAALPSGERGFELQGKAYDPIERFLRDLIAKDRERKALPPPPREGEGFTFSDSTDSPKTMLRKGEPSWTAGRLPEEGELQVDYKPRLTRGGTPFKSVATAQAAINKLGLQDSFVVVPVEGGYGLKRAGTSPKPSAGEIVEPGATSGGVGQEVPESDRVTGGGAVPGRSDRIKTAAGTPVDIQYAVVPADSLIASHDTAMRINKNYPASLQPRDRTRAASDVQVSGIAKKLDPNFLGESYDAGTGAPIVGKDLVVESGNGRVIAVKMAYENIPDKAAAYREWLDANAEKFGVDRAAIGKMKNPVLVRVRTTPVDRVAFSREANEAGIAAMSAVEQAKVDAAKMKPGLMDLLDAGEAGDLTAAANRDFVRGFLEAVVSPSERGRYLTKDGLVSQEGVNRMRNAVFARAYGESQALSLLSEATDSNIRNITNSLVAVAGKMTQLDDMIKKGKRHPLSISQAIGQAADKMSTLRQQGMSVDAYLKQGAMFDDGLTDQAKGLLWVFDEFKRSSKALTNILAGYVEQVNKVGDPHQQSLLDNAPIPDYNDLIQRSISDERAGRQQTVYPDLFEAGVGAAGSAKEASGDRRGVSEARREWDREPAGTAGAAAEREGISSRKRSYGTAQVEIDFEGARPLPDGGGVEYPLVGEAKIGAAKSDYQDEFTSQDAAQIGRDLISKYPQEHLIAIFTDKNGRPVSVMRHVIGGTTSSATYIELIVGKAVNYDAGGIYMVHNHPSGNTRLSDPDMRLFRALGGLLQGTGIEAKDMIAVGPETWGNSQGSNIAFPADAKGKEGIEIPYFERVFASPGKKLTTISGKDDFLRYARKEMPDGGIILLNAVNEVVATMKGLPDYGAIRKAGLRELLGESEKRAAAAMLIYEPNRALSFDDIKNVGAFANAAGLALHDVYTKRGSYREAYGNPQQGAGNIFHEGITSLFSPEAWRRNFIPLAKDLPRAVPRLEALGRFVFDAGKKTAKEWVAAMKSYLGDLWTKFREQLRDIWNNLKAMNRKKGPVGDERGSLTKGKEPGKDAAMSKDKGTGNIPAKETPTPEAGTISISSRFSGSAKEALAYALENVRGSAVNAQTNMRVGIRRKGIEKALSESAVKKSVNKNAHIEAIQALRKIVENGIERDKPTADKYNDPNVRLIHRLYAPIIVDGVKYEVKATIKEYNRKDQSPGFYTYELSDIEIPARIWADSTVAQERPTSAPHAGSDSKLAMSSGNVKPENVPGQLGRPQEIPIDWNKNELVDMDGVPMEVNPDGTVTLYHRTTPEKATEIRRTGAFKSLENTDETFFSNKMEGQAEGYGNAVIAIKINPRWTRLNDAFHGGEIHVAVPNKRLSKKNIIDFPNPSRPPEVGGQSGPILYSGIDISKVPEVLKYLRDNFVPGKLKDFAETAVLSRDDVTLLQRIWHAPQWLAKKHPEFQAFFDRQQKREKDRAKLLDARLKGWESARDLSGEERKKLAKVIWIAEGKKFKSVTEPRFLWKDNEWGAEGGKGKPLQVVKGLNLKHYRQIADYLKDRGVPERVIAAYVDIRKNFDRSYAMILDKMVSMKDVDADTITKYRQEIGNISNYFPHQWYGNYAFHGLDANGDVVVRIQYNDTTLKGRSARYWSKLKQAKADYPEVASWTKAQKVQQMPEEVYEHPIPVEAMEQIIDAAVARVKSADPAAAGIFKKAMPEAVSDVMKSRGFGGHMIRRKGVKGYEKDDVFRVLHDFDSSFSGWLTKIEAARDFSELLRSISAKDAPGLYSYASRYVKDVLANADRVDRAVDTLRAAIFLNYLGFNLKTGVVNTTQPIINGMPRLSVDVGWRAGSWLKAAADDLVGAMTKGRNLKADEARLLDELYREGVTQAQFAIEAKGKISGWGARTLNYLNNAAGWFMSITERFNRGSLALAAYRLARDGHIKNEKTLNKYGLKKGQKADYETAMKFAEEVNADANFTYGKGNLPEWLRGRTKLLRAGYSLASFSHNLMQMWGWMLRQGGPGMRAFAMSILGMAIFGGLKSMPFISPLVEAWRKNTGIDPVKALRDILPDVMKDVVTYGAPAAVGVNIGGSLEIGNIDTANPAKFIIGVPWSLVEEPLRAKKAYESGQTGRAVEEMMPTAIKNPMAAWRLHEQGQYSISGQPINMPGQAGPRKISALEAIGKAFGFQPVSSTKARDVREALDNLEEFVKSKQTKWANQYVNAYNRKDLKEMAIIQDQVQEWNRRWLRQDKPEYIIRLGDAVRNRIKPHQEPKKFRPLGLQYTEDNL